MENLLNQNQQILTQLSKIKLLSLDVDGVLTDGGIFYSEDGSISRKFNVKDGVGIKRIIKIGIKVAIISAGVSGSIPSRAATLGITHVFTGVNDKRSVLENLSKDLKIDLENSAHIGDDINDLELFKIIGFPIAVADAQPEVLDAAKIITQKKGGQGAVREICDALIQSSV